MKPPTEAELSAATKLMHVKDGPWETTRELAEFAGSPRLRAWSRLVVARLPGLFVAVDAKSPKEGIALAVNGALVHGVLLGLTIGESRARGVTRKAGKKKAGAD